MILEAFSSYADAVGSPFIVPVAGCFMVLGIVVASMWSGARKREIESQERLAAIAKGITPPPTADELAQTQSRPIPSAFRRRANIRLSGIVLIAAAAGIVLFFVALAAILQERDVLCGAACGLIPFGIGVGFLIDTRIQSREIDEATTTPHPYNS
ncbi:MAG: DUF6249 domain-containing protein [Acidobacteriaceae bacterium]